MGKESLDKVLEGIESMSTEGLLSFCLAVRVMEYPQLREVSSRITERMFTGIAEGSEYWHQVSNAMNDRQKMLGMQKKLHKLGSASLHDRLCKNLYAFDFFNSRGAQMLAEDYYQDIPISLAFIDLDHFRRINNSFGHNAANGVIVKCAETIQDNLKGTDLIARYGGDEFIALMPEATEAQAKVAGERVYSAIKSLEIPHEKGIIKVSCSVGIAQAQKDETIQSLEDRADDVMYFVKAKGRNGAFTYGEVIGNPEFMQCIKDRATSYYLER